MIQVFDKHCINEEQKENYKLMPINLASTIIKSNINNVISEYFKRYLNVVYITLDNEKGIIFDEENTLTLRRNIMSIIKEYSINNSILILSDIGTNTMDNIGRALMNSCGFTEVELSSGNIISVFRNDLTSFRNRRK